ncbi:MAG: GNAT family N-acetyltransferase [Chloroflexi bacterium]|nr:GNAT family N-acetyltransferase [Chloroflexota bacterium]
MPDEDIRIERVTVKDLRAFAAGIVEAAQPGEFIPITMQRALAMAKNPYADPDDAALLVAYHGEALISYFGMMAVMLQQGRERHKAQWFTTWMVAKNYLGRGVGSRLMQAAVDLEQDYLIVGSKPARGVCDKFGFERLPPYEFTVIDFRMAARFNPITLLFRGLRKALHLVGINIDIAKVNRIAALTFERLLGTFVRPILYALATLRVMRGLPDHRFEEVAEVHSPVWDEAAGTSATRLYRGDEVVNWMLRYPWVLQPGQSQSEGLDFYFSDTRAEFKIFAHEIYSDDYRGYVAFQFSVIGDSRVLKVLDVSLISELDARYVLPMALAVAKSKGAHQIEIPSEYATALESGVLGKLIMTKKQRICQVHPKAEDSSLGKAWRNLQQNYVDGDTPFS